MDEFRLGVVRRPPHRRIQVIPGPMIEPAASMDYNRTYGAPMRLLMVILVAVSLFLITGCEERPPISRAQVVSNAAHLQLRDEIKWGEAIEVLQPGPMDANNKLWWQLRYHPGADGLNRIIIVDANSGWARLPPPDYQVRLPPPTKTSGENPENIYRGTYIVVILPGADPGDKSQMELEREVRRLNALANNTGLPPLFSLRPTRDGRQSLIYGWSNNQGIERHDRVITWLTVRTPYRDPQWENLAATP